MKPIQKSKSAGVGRKVIAREPGDISVVDFYLSKALTNADTQPRKPRYFSSDRTPLAKFPTETPYPILSARK